MPNVHSPSLDSVESGAPANEIEITLEMIEAGEFVLWRELCGSMLSPGFSVQETAERVFLAMAASYRSNEAGAGAPAEIEITSAMIKAGVLAYVSYDPRFEDLEDVVPRVYKAMENSKRLALGELQPKKPKTKKAAK